MLYYIKNKNSTIGTFRWEGPELAQYAVLHSDTGLPWFISRALTAWLTRRALPKHRENIPALLSACGFCQVRDVLDCSMGLSLLDTFWVTRNPDLAWDEVSLFKNQFDKRLAELALHGKAADPAPILPGLSGEFATGGALPKCWVRQNGFIRLKKGGTAGALNAGNEPYSETMVSQILDVLGYRHVPYQVEYFQGRVVSSCPLMTSQQQMLLPMYTYGIFSSLGLIVQKCNELGIAEQLYEHLIIDYLTCNTDRHLGNLGVLPDADTYEIISMAPIYDNGRGMLPAWTPHTSLQKYISGLPGTALGVSFHTAASVAKGAVGSHGVERLIGFRFDRRKLPDFSEERLEALEAFLQVRVRAYLDI